MRARFAIAAACAAVAGLVVAGTALAHRGGKAEPRIAAGVSQGSGLLRFITVRLTDIDQGTRISGAIVTAAAEMTEPDLMRTAPWRLGQTSPGIYRARVRFPMAAEWSVRIDVLGEKVVAATTHLPVRIERSAVVQPPPSADDGVEVLPTRLENDLTQRDVVSMVVLWIHGLAALGWIVGVLVIAVALSTRPGVLAEGLRSKVRDAYIEWGAWVHWSLVLWIVLTGVYNMLVVTPFRLAWRPSEIAQLGDVPYGALYEAILVVKLALFMALLITGTWVLLRTVGDGDVPPAAEVEGAGFLRTLASALGTPGIVYLALVPLILGAAVALRYVHILSHAGGGISAS